jgi:PAS domain S-box-containing protein
MNKSLIPANENPLLISEFVDATSAVIILCNMNTDKRIFHVSDTMRQFGYEPSDFLDQKLSISDFVHPGDYTSVISELRRAEANQQSFVVQTFRIRDAREHIHWINCWTILKNQRPDLAYKFKSILVDVTEHKLSEQQFKIQEADYQRIIANAGSNYFFYIHNSDGIFTYLSPTIKEMLGYSTDEFLRHYDTYLTDHPINDLTTFRTNQALLGIKQAPYQVEVYHKNGNTVRLQITEVPVYDNQHNVTSVVGIAHDITKLINQQQLLERGQQRLKAILDGLTDSVIIIDAGNKIQSINRAAEKLFCYSSEEANNLLITKLIYQLKINGKLIKAPNYPGSLFDICEQLTLGNSPIEANAHTKYKVPLTLRLNVSSLPDSHNQYILSCSDITQEKSQELQLLRAQKMDALGKMTGGICHDFNNILGIISGYASLLESADRGDPQCDNYISQIRKASERGARLSRKLLSFSGKKINESQTVCINEVLEQEQQMLSRILTPLIHIEMKLDNKLWPVFANSGDLEDAILNICLNAGHAMPDGGTLTISTRNASLTEAEAFTLNIETGDYVLLSIKDSGSGMDESTLSKVFDPFFSTKEEGTGLGLSQAYNFVRSSEGGISVTSEIGKGTEFLLYFPKNTQDANPRPRLDTGHFTSPYTQSSHILVVDDEAALRDITARQLSKHGHVVFLARNGIEALKILATEPIELIISDIVMPEMDGWELARETQKRYPEVIIQLLTGYGEGFQRNQSDLGSELLSTVLHKPLSEKALTERVKNLLYIKHLNLKKEPVIIED